MRHIVYVAIMMMFLAACSQEEPFNPDDCFSLDFIRVKLDDKIFDIPHGVRLSSLSQKEREGLFIDLPPEYRGEQFVQCLKKEHAPLDMADYDHVISLFIAEGPNRGHTEIPKIISFKASGWRGGSKGSILNIRENLFTLDEIPNITLLEEIKNPNNYDDSFTYIFGYKNKKQDIVCNQAGCSRLFFQIDGLIYAISPIKYYNKGVMEIDEIIPTEDLPETVLPVLNLVRSFRNKEAERQAQ